MRITILQGTAKCVLSDHGLESPSGLVISEAGATQVAEFVRGAGAKPIDRGNRRTSVQFSVTRQHKDILAAQRFLVSHLTSMIWEGVLMFEFRGLVGDRAEQYLPNTVIEAVQGNHMGATTIHQYQIVGSILQSTKP